MAIAVVCPQCGARLNAPDIAAGKRVKCPKCQALVNVPQTAPASSMGYVEVVPSPAPPPGRALGKPSVPRVAVAGRDDDDEVPTRKKRKKSSDSDSNVMLIRNIIGGIVLVILLGVAGYIYYTKFFAHRDGDDQASVKSGSDTAAPPPGGFVPLDKAENMGKGPPLIPIIPGGPVAGGVPKTGGGGPITKGGGGGGSPRPKDGAKPTITTPVGLTVTFPGTPRKSDSLARQLLVKRGLTGDVYLWSDGGSACTLVVAQLAAGSTEEQGRKQTEYIIQELANLDSGYKLVERNTITHGGRNFDRLLSRSPDESRSIESWILLSDQNIFIASIEIPKDEASTAVQQFLTNIR
jgi:hypothetical protein